MIPIDFMDDEVAYQMACDRGFDSRAYLEMEIDRRQDALHDDVIAIEVQLLEGARRVMDTISVLMQEIRQNNPSRAAGEQFNHVTHSVQELRELKQKTSNVLEAVKNHFNEALAQQRNLHARLNDLQHAYRKKQQADPIILFLNEGGERASNTIARATTYHRK